MSSFPSWVRVVLRLAALLALPVASARSQNLQITGVTASQYWANTAPEGETDSRIRIGLSVQNTSGSSVVVIGFMDSCGPFAYSDGGCPGWGNAPSIGAGQTGTVYLDFVGSGSGGDANIVVYVQSRYVGGYSATAIVHIVAGSWGYPVTATIVTPTFTPQVTPKGGNVSVMALYSYASATFYIQNVGSAAAAFKLKPVCGAWTPTCTVADTLLYLASGELRTAAVGFQSGTVGNTGVVKLIATSPPQSNGVIKVDTGSVTVLSVDAVAPSITFTPVGTVQDGEYSEYWTTDHYIWIYVDVCDYDGNVGAPSLSFNNNAIPYITLQTTTVAGCTTSKRASYNVTLQSIPGQEYANVATITVSDGVHTTTGTQIFRYDDSNDHRPTVTVVHPSITRQAGQTVVDTFRVTNPGWHTATYSLAAWCRFDNYNYCGASPGVGSVTVAAGATASFPITFPISAIAGNKTTVGPSITYAGVMSTHTWTDSMKATPALLQPPTVSIAPANGTTVTTGTVNLLVLWCDPDGGIATHTVAWQGQTLADTYTPEPRAGCVTAGRSTYNGIAINPWQQTVLATIVDSEGHSVSATSNVTFNLPIANFAPLVTPKNAWHVFARSVAVSDTFTIKNTGGYNATYAISASCGSIGACTSNVSSLSVAPAATGNAIVSYTSPNVLGAGDTVRLVARYTTPGGAAIADTGKKYAIVPVVESTPVVEAPTAATMAPYMMMCCFTFKVTNPGSAQVQMHIVTSATNGFSFQPVTYSTDSILPIDAGATAVLYVPPKSPAASGVTGAYTVTASYVNTAGVTLAASATSYVTTTATATIAVAVTPHAISASRPAGVNRTQQFDITMTGDGSSAFSYSIACTGQAVSCAGNDTTGTLTSSNRTASINVDYTTGPTTGLTGFIRLIAVSASYPAVTDTGTVTINTAVVDNVTVDTRNLNPRIHVSRGGCLTIAAGDGAAYECGDLRIVHALPTTTTMNKARTPALIYNSAHARTRQVLAADVTIQPTIHPTSLHASLAIAGLSAPVERDTTWNWSWNDGVTRRVAISFDAQALGLPTGAYHYELEIQARDGTTTIGQGKDTATMIIVNRAANGSNTFGRGWWLDGLEQLAFAPTPSSTQILWVGGDGSGRLYTKVAGTSKWAVTPMVDGPDTLEQITGGYKRWMQSKAYVQFDNAGKHVTTMNRQGHATTFAYTDGLLTSLTLPVPAGGLSRSYAFAYAGTQLVMVMAPAVPGAPRVTTLAYVSGTDRISSITDPDNHSIVFGTEASTGNITARTDKRGFTTTFSYDEAGKLRQSSLAMQGTGADIVTTFCAAESRGAAACPRALNLASVYTLVDGPRTDVGDTTKLYVNRFGAPDTVVNALGHRTSIGRSATLPMLATSVTQPNGFTTLATYNTRGLIETQTAVAPLGADNAVTKYFWNSVWDELDSLIAPTGERTHFGYDGTYPLRVWQQAGNSVARRERFGYDPNTRLVVADTAPSPLAPQRFEYDAQGNLKATVSGLGFRTEFIRDALGRDSVVTSPIDSGFTTRRTQAFAYDRMSRDTLMTDSAPTSASDPTVKTLRVTNQFDDQGNLIRVTRMVAPDPANLRTVALAYEFDGAGRQKREFDPERVQTIGEWRFDAVGNVRTSLRAGDSVTTEFDALNRIVHRVVGGVVTSANLQRSDDQHFSYDSLGNLTSATNYAAKVRRGYFRNGSLRADTLSIASANLAEAEATRFSRHMYVTGYGYDLAGRRSALIPPAGFGLGSVSYAYDAETGALATIGDPNIGVFRYVYNKAGLIDSLWQPDGTGETHGWDADGRERTRREWNPATGTLHDQLSTLDARGKRLNVSGSGLSGEAVTYDGLGALKSSSGRTVEVMTTDALGNMLARVRSSDPYQENFAYEPHTTRLHYITQQTGDYSADSTSQSHNAAGDVVQIHERIVGPIMCGASAAASAPCGSQTTARRLVAESHLINYYDAAGRLTYAVKETSNDASSTWPSASIRDPNAYDVYSKFERGVAEEYRYDALGRRIWVRAHRNAYCPGANERDSTSVCLSTIERTVYDGDQVLIEIRQPGDDTTSVERLESDSVLPSASPAQHFGLVGYLHGFNIDHPLALTRNYDGTFTRVILHYEWQFGLDLATRLDGTVVQPCTTAPCSGDNPDWPGRHMTVGLVIPSSSLGPVSWWGTLAAMKPNATGLRDMRNRQYDPRSGRFTQEDPIGLAGGMNLYGFAGGDPVNFTDPFGLTPDCGLLPCPVLAGSAAAAGGTLGAIMGVIGMVGAPVAAIVGLDQAFGPMHGEPLVTSRARSDATTFATRQARGIDRTRTSLGIAGEHIARVGGLGPDDEDPEGKKRDWLSHARKHLNNARKYVEDVKGKTREELQRQIDELQRQISRISPS